MRPQHRTHRRRGAGNLTNANAITSSHQWLQEVCKSRRAQSVRGRESVHTREKEWQDESLRRKAQNTQGLGDEKEPGLPGGQWRSRWWRREHDVR
jgi:hypothetical protein